MATIASAKDKLRAKISDMPANYDDAMKDFFGSDVSGSGPSKAYKAKVKPGMEDIWEKKLKRAFGIR